MFSSFSKFYINFSANLLSHILSYWTSLKSCYLVERGQLIADDRATGGSNDRNLFTTQSRLLMTLRQSALLKTLWEKEKMLVTSIFSFSHNVFYSSQNKFQVFSHIHSVICKVFYSGLVQNFVLWYSHKYF